MTAKWADPYWVALLREVQRIATQYLGSGDDADELAQRVMEILLRKPEFNGSAGPMDLLHPTRHSGRIRQFVRNTLLNFRRGNRRALPTICDEHLAMSGGAVGGKADQSDARLDADSLLERFGPETDIGLAIRVILGKIDPTEATNDWGHSEKTVRRWVAAGLARLQEVLKVEKKHD